MARPAAVSAPKAVPSPGTATAPAAPQPAGGGRGTVAAGTVLSSALGLVWVGDSKPLSQDAGEGDLEESGAP